jgi:hypothetical protein
MRRVRLASWASLSLALAPVPAAAQAPASADLWRLATATLAGPAALETGPGGAFWNPAATWDGARLRAGAHILQTPDILGVGAYLVGASYRLSDVAAQVLVGRTEVGDLVRTTTSPASDPGGIPVYEQLAGLGAAMHRGPLSAGVLLRAHEARFDTERSRGLTLDAGFRAQWPGLVIAGATHFFPLDLTGRDVTDFYAGAACRPLRLRVAGAPAEVLVRYGLSLRRPAPASPAATAARRALAEHALGAGLVLDRHFRLDGVVVRETGFLESSWRPSVGIELTVGRYTLSVSRSNGLSGIGASYRVGLDVDVVQ